MSITQSRKLGTVQDDASFISAKTKNCNCTQFKPTTTSSCVKLLDPWVDFVVIPYDVFVLPDDAPLFDMDAHFIEHQAEQEVTTCPVIVENVPRFLCPFVETITTDAVSGDDMQELLVTCKRVVEPSQSSKRSADQAVDFDTILKHTMSKRVRLNN